MAYSNRPYITTSRDRYQRRLMYLLLDAQPYLLGDPNAVVVGIRIAHQCYACRVNGTKRRFNGARWCEGITHV